MNWIGIGFCCIFVIGVPVGMAVVLIRDHIKAKRRDRRCHRGIKYWWEMEVK